MQKALHPRDDISRLYVSRKEGGRGLANIDTTTRRLHKKKSKETLITVARKNKQYKDQQNKNN